MQNFTGSLTRYEFLISLKNVYCLTFEQNMVKGLINYSMKNKTVFDSLTCDP